MKPTREQIDEARETYTAHVVTSLDDGEHDDLRQAIRVLLAATKPATNDAAVVILESPPPDEEPSPEHEPYCDGYACGACHTEADQ